MKHPFQIALRSSTHFKTVSFYSDLGLAICIVGVNCYLHKYELNAKTPKIKSSRKQMEEKGLKIKSRKIRDKPICRRPVYTGGAELCG